jgi:sRNA-binding regulator protein Hfq
MSDAEKLIELAKKRFEDFGEADEVLFTAVADGTLANYTEGGDKDKIENAGGWTERRIIKANRIEWLCRDRQAKELVTDKGILVKGAKIEGVVDISFAEIPFPLGFSRCVFTEVINIQHSRIKDLSLNGSHTRSIWADGVKVEGGVFLRDGFKAKGVVRFPRATIGGDFDCTVGEFINKDESVIIADGMGIEGTVFLKNGFKAEGAVSFIGAEIGGDFDCEKGEFINEKGNAILANKMFVKGSVYLRKGFKAKGEVCFRGATIGRLFSWSDVELMDKTELDLRNAKVGVLWDDVKSWPERGNLFLDGFVYENIGDGAPKDAESRIEWLNRQDEKQFRPGPYEQLANVLNRMGHREDAKKILIKKEKKITRRGGFGWRMFWRGVLGVTIGYGYRPWRALWFIGFFILLGYGIFGSGYKTGVIVPVEKDAYVSGQCGLLREGYPKFNSFVYSVDEFVPVLDLHMKKYWRPDANKSWMLSFKKWSFRVSGDFMRWYMWGHICAGWILTTLLVVGLTGLVKK